MSRASTPPFSFTMAPRSTFWTSRRKGSKRKGLQNTQRISKLLILKHVTHDILKYMIYYIIMIYMRSFCMSQLADLWKCSGKLITQQCLLYDAVISVSTGNKSSCLEPGFGFYRSDAEVGAWRLQCIYFKNPKRNQIRQHLWHWWSAAYPQYWQSRRFSTVSALSSHLLQLRT